MRIPFKLTALRVLRPEGEHPLLSAYDSLEMPKSWGKRQNRLLHTAHGDETGRSKQFSFLMDGSPRAKNGVTLEAREWATESHGLGHFRLLMTIHMTIHDSMCQILQWHIR